MAITTTKEKYAVLNVNDWTWAALPHPATGGLDSQEKKILMHGFPTQVWSGAVIVEEVLEWLTHYRRNSKR